MYRYLAWSNVTFLFWGIYHGCFLMLEEFVPFFRKEGGKIKTAVMRIYTLLVVCIGFVFFRADTMTQGVQWVKAMFTGFSMGAASTSLALQQLTPLYLATFTVACIASFPVFEKWKAMADIRNSITIWLLYAVSPDLFYAC